MMHAHVEYAEVPEVDWSTGIGTQVAAVADDYMQRPTTRVLSPQTEFTDHDQLSGSAGSHLRCEVQ